jgi:ABC-type microcin C transport system permease subunit YejB
MIVYLLRRLLATIPTIFGVALILFLLLDVVGGDPRLKKFVTSIISIARYQFSLESFSSRSSPSITAEAFLPVGALAKS